MLNGGIDVNIPEAKVSVDDPYSEQPTIYFEKVRSMIQLGACNTVLTISCDALRQTNKDKELSRNLVAECMIMFGEFLGEYGRRHGIPMPYR